MISGDKRIETPGGGRRYVKTFADDGSATRFRIRRTGQKGLSFLGWELVSVKHNRCDKDDRDTGERYPEVDVYRTAGGKWIAHATHYFSSVLTTKFNGMEYHQTVWAEAFSVNVAARAEELVLPRELADSVFEALDVWDSVE